jgi:uncharacterized Zn-binding protein involved in type VI secretion
MVRRYNITLGAKTSAGDVVSSASPFSKTNGVPLAIEGDTIDCPACHSKGRIKCAGTRLSSTLNGKQYSLSDDICICNCNPPPRLIARFMTALSSSARQRTYKPELDTFKR